MGGTGQRGVCGVYRAVTSQGWDVLAQVRCPPPHASCHLLVSLRSPGSWHRQAALRPSCEEEGTGIIWAQDGHGGFATTMRWALGLPYFVFFLQLQGQQSWGTPRTCPSGG